ncbi:Auxin-responsive protein SAUR15 [Linum grandiflorum]
MGILHLPSSVISGAKQILKRQPSSSSSSRRSVPKGHIAVYVGEVDERKRFVVPISVLNHPLFLDLLKLAEDEFGYYPPHGALTIPCHEHEFIDLLVASSLLYTL